jgi:hypothetical protein
VLVFALHSLVCCFIAIGHLNPNEENETWIWRMRLYDKDEPHTALGEQVTYRSGIVERDIYCTAMYFVTSSITTVG